MSATLIFLNTHGDLVRMPECDDVNMSNSNARFVLAALGLNPNFDGSDPTQKQSDALSPDEFQTTLERYLTSEINTLVDLGQPVRLVAGDDGGCQIYDMGRRDGYVTDKVEAMLQTTKKATLMGATKCYFS